MFKNIAEIRAYLGLAKVEEQCIAVLAHLFNAHTGFEDTDGKALEH
jgi:glutamate/tyrosine decarboxylase-like PLP-dependent enzyme